MNEDSSMLLKPLNPNASAEVTPYKNKNTKWHRFSLNAEEKKSAFRIMENDVIDNPQWSNSSPDYMSLSFRKSKSDDILSKNLSYIYKSESKSDNSEEINIFFNNNTSNNESNGENADFDSDFKCSKTAVEYQIHNVSIRKDPRDINRITCTITKV